MRLRLGNVWLAAMTVVVTAGTLLAYRSSLPPQVPLWYSRPWGEDQLAHPGWLWLVPGLIILAAAAGEAGRRWLRHYQLLAVLWVVSTMIVQLILALGIVRIVWLVAF